MHKLGSRCMSSIVVVVAVGLLASQASAGVHPWTNGNANELDFTITCTVTQLDATGRSDLGIGGAWAGKYLYEYEVKVTGAGSWTVWEGGSLVTYTGNAEDPDHFQVDWRGITPLLQGKVDGDSTKLTWTTMPGTWNDAAPSTGPTGAGTNLTWAATVTDKRWARTQNQVLGTLWAVAGGPPTLGTGKITNGLPASTGDCCVPTPGLPSCLLLLTSGMPMLGIGYLRKRRST